MRWAWDGNPANRGGGAGVTNGRNYLGTQFVTPLSMEIDAIAHHDDALFRPLINDVAHLVFSIGNGTSPTGNSRVLDINALEAVSVPEPSGAGLVVLVGVWLGARRRQHVVMTFNGAPEELAAVDRLLEKSPLASSGGKRVWLA